MLCRLRLNHGVPWHALIYVCLREREAVCLQDRLMCCPAVEDGEYGVHRDQLRLKPYAMTVRVSGGHYDVTRCIQKDGLYSRIYQRKSTPIVLSVVYSSS